MTDRRSPFASYETTETTTPSGYTLHLRDELTARETFDLLKRMQSPDDMFANFVCRLFIEGWDLKTEDGEIAAIDDTNLDGLWFGTRREIQTAVDAHARAYLTAVLPEVLTEATDDAPLAQSPTKGKKPRRTRA